MCCNHQRKYCNSSYSCAGPYIPDLNGTAYMEIIKDMSGAINIVFLRNKNYGTKRGLTIAEW
jgi:hypothetical protein